MSPKTLRQYAQALKLTPITTAKFCGFKWSPSKDHMPLDPATVCEGFGIAPEELSHFMNGTDELLTAGEIADRVGCMVNRIYTLHQLGVILPRPVFSFGQKVRRWRRSDIERRLPALKNVSVKSTNLHPTVYEMEGAAA